MSRTGFRRRGFSGGRGAGLGAVWWALALGLAAALGGCAFDDSRLAELRADTQPIPEIGGDRDAGPDLPLDLGDAGDDASDLPGDPPDDVAVDTTDVADQPDVSDAVDAVDAVDVALDVVDLVEDVVTDAADVVDAVDAPDAVDVEVEPAENEPPELTLPGTPSVEGFLSVAITGVVLSDPDVGDGDMRLTLTPSLGVVSFGVIGEELVFETGDGTRDPLIEVTGPLAALQEALDGLLFHATDVGPATGSIEFGVSDLGNTGAGGPRTLRATLDVDILEREHDYSVSRGTSVIPNGQATLTLQAGADYQAPLGEGFVRLVNTRLSGMGRTSSGGTKDPGRWMVLVDASTDLETSITFRRFSTNDDCRITWEIIDYQGSPSGANALVVRAQGVASYGQNDLVSGRVDVAGVQADSDVVVFVTGQLVSTSATGDTNLGLSTADWDAANDQAVFTRGESGRPAEVSYAVVEFGGANWTVQRVEHQYASAGPESETFGTPVNLARAFLHAQHRTGAGVDDEVGARIGLSAVNAVRFELNGGANTFADKVSVAWVIANSQTGERAMRVEHVQAMRNGGSSEEDIWSDPLAQPVDTLGWASIMGESGHASGGVSKPPRGSISLQLVDRDEVELRQSDNGAVQTYGFSVVQWPDE